MFTVVMQACILTSENAVCSPFTAVVQTYVQIKEEAMGSDIY